MLINEQEYNIYIFLVLLIIDFNMLKKYRISENEILL